MLMSLKDGGARKGGYTSRESKRVRGREGGREKDKERDGEREKAGERENASLFHVLC